MKEFATLDKAIELAKQGYAVYPLIENTKKPPKGVAGYQAATSDQNTIFTWFEDHTAYNLGLRLDLSDLLVVDIDMHEPTKNGRASLTQLFKQGQTLPSDTYIEGTANGGLHYFLKYAGAKVRKVDVWPGIDLLSDFTVIAPSEINGKPYEPLDGRTLADIKPAPQWLVDKLAGQKVNWTSEHACTTHQKKYTGRLLDEMVTGTVQGNRNAWLTKMIGRLFVTGAEPETIYELACSINERFIDQPLETKEVTTIYNSILKREMKQFERNSIRNSRIAG
ncbi:DNA replication protein (plasmid) [Loigolactobacillus backii]|uniref:bifunctional DNA primase/polymerase n=1 Tax=Loigolactobacillus backii TaxID=375175 RepID=UPI0007F151EA|nr:bifunctional DNA primase/polymerase [Loigolactobacillus backii]ANK61237.1 DNA replication protein [Loigolactobacillus backii]ANK66135.1 DNA replication protein [Loigolactobacillus backii]ANK68606.1 DNA replication protein [Loigolactobacillus backii]OLF69014.1 DNA replication protein [Loigolactobacillus backii]PIO88643.1 DNA replication protein [Loigolactobacillus backii]